MTLVIAIMMRIITIVKCVHIYINTYIKGERERKREPMRETDRQIKTEQEIKRERISEAERERE